MAIAQSDGSIILTTKVDETGIKKSFSSIKTLASKAFLAVGAAAATATVAITKMAVSAYADYEQLVGGVETLFKGSAQKVIDYANDAFYTAGVSANEYMKQVTSFSASLLSSLAGDTNKAADIANMALIDISDNANKMGSSLESVTLAYQGFAKQQYMLLDNLKLGYGGTKTEMERLLKDAEAYLATQGKTAKFSIDNLADVYTAINAIQQKLDIAGTTAKEAEKTITGSANMMKAAWQNVLSAIAGGGDLDRAINNLVYSIQKYFENIVPVVERALLGIGTMIEKIAPLLVKTVAKSFIQALPSLIYAVYQMFFGLMVGIAEGVKALFSGKSTEILKEQSEQISQATSNQKELTEAVKETNEELKKSVASFDTIETLSSQTSGSEKIDDSASVGLGSIFDEDMTASSKAQDTVSEALLGVMTVAGLSLAAIGMILIATGHIAWGVGFLIAGIAIFAISAATLNSDAVSEETKKALAGAIVVAGVVAIILGLLVCLTGRWGLGLGLIIMGAISIVAAVGLNWNAVRSALEDNIGTALAIVGVVAIVLGVLLCFAQHWGIGIGLIVTGALSVGTTVVVHWSAIKTALSSSLGTALSIVGFVAIVLGVLLCFAQRWAIGIGLILTGVMAIGTTVAVNWSAIKEKIQGHLGTALSIVGIVAIVLGVLLCFAQRWMIGIGLILTGATATGITVAINWESIKEKTSEAINDVSNWLKTWGLLVLGVLLCFTGVGIPLGLALIKKGAENLVKSENPDWQITGSNIQKTINNIGSWLKTWGLLVLGTLLCVSGIGLPLGIALIKKGAENLAQSEDPKWKTVGDKIQEVFQNIENWLKSWGLLVLGVLLCFTGVGIPLGVALIKKGAENLAKSDNPKWETIGNKIKEIFENIRNWLKTWGLLVLGVILCFTGVGIPLGMGLIKKGAENLAQAKDPLWSSMLDNIKATWAKIKEYWRNNIAKYFTADWWGSLARNAVNGLLRWFINGINKLIDKLNSFGFALPDVLGGGRVGFNISKLSVPQLAKGAVLPPNHPFLAVVGDQKQGTNIEAPADLIKQMAMEAIIEAGGMGGGQTVREEHYYLDETELMSVIYRLVKGGERLNGNSLVTGGAY